MRAPIPHFGKIHPAHATRRLAYQGMTAVLTGEHMVPTAGKRGIRKMAAQGTNHVTGAGHAYARAKGIINT